MEKQSQNHASRRRRGNRSGGGNRNRNRSGGNRNGYRGGTRSGGGNRNNRNRNRNRNRSRRRPAPKPTAWQKFLQLISFGKLGQPKRKPRRKQQPQKKAAATAATSTPKPDNTKRRRQRNEVTSGRLYVGNLAYATTEEELEGLFRGFGTVMSAEVVTNSRTQQSKGFAFVEMASIDQAKRAVDILDDQDFMGRKLTVSGARSEGPKKPKEAETVPDSWENPTEQPKAEDLAASAETNEAPLEESAPVVEMMPQEQQAEAQKEEEPEQDAAQATV
ncbi:MAG: hypothetical protein VXX36_00545 [Verrucomicrobiota bacterium]|nr:hypothetical protein [Verrucomicrobiota bacterium]